MVHLKHVSHLIHSPGDAIGSLLLCYYKAAMGSYPYLSLGTSHLEETNSERSSDFVSYRVRDLPMMRVLEPWPKHHHASPKTTGH
jgi:hypothetical protein